MRWTIPTLIQQLVDQGVPITTAADIVTLSYPDTHGETTYRWRESGADGDTAVGAYAIWDKLRGDESPLGGTKVSDDARSLNQFGRLNRWRLADLVKITDMPDYVTRHIADEAASMIRAGSYFEPRQVEEPSPIPGMTDELAASIIRADAAWDYVRSIDLPHFGS